LGAGVVGLAQYLTGDEIVRPDDPRRYCAYPNVDGCRMACDILL
jgi:hypothetical protein